MTSDFCNGCFEAAGALLIILHILRIRRDKTVHGVHWFPFAFFLSWGFWNLFWYSSLGCWFSFAGGVLMVSVYNYYCYCLWCYWPRKGKV